jgi:TRAP-type C4-dicarboxylate transport system permease small subunit
MPFVCCRTNGSSYRLENSMKRFVRTIDGIAAVSGGLAGVMLCIGLAMAFIEIILRSAFSSTLYITEEYSGYLMCGLTFCGLGYTLREKGHIRMTFLHRIVIGKSRWYLDMVCYAAGCIFCAAITGFSGEFFWDSVVTRSQSMQLSETYLAIPQFFMPFGALIMTLQFLSEFLKTFLELKGDTGGLAIREEAEDLGR